MKQQPELPPPQNPQYQQQHQYPQQGGGAQFNQPQYQQQPPPQQYNAQPQYQQQQYGGYAQPGAGGKATMGTAVAPGDGKTSSDVVAGIPLYDEDLGEASSKFVVRGYKDVWAIVVFAVVMLGTCIAGIYYRGAKLEGYENFQGEAGRWLPWAGVTAFGIAALSLAVMRCAPVGYIYFANILGICMIFIAAIFAFTAGQYWMGAMMGIAGVLNAVWFYSVRHRIPFAALLLKTASSLSTKYFGVFFVGATSMIALVVFFTLWGLAALPILGNLENNNYGNAGGFFLTFLMVVIIFWAVQVGANVTHVTASGVVATWYFAGEQRMPPNPTPANVRRAMTTSFGSICFGSLVVAVLKTIYYFLRKLADTECEDMPVVRCIVMCLIGIIERLTEMFNLYAFTYVAIYGYDFVTAAKETFKLAKECGWAAVFNDSLVWPVLTLTNFFGSFFVAALFGVLSGSGAIAAMSFLLAQVIFVVFFRPVYSGVATQFICIAENEQVMHLTNPTYAAEVTATVPADVRATPRQQA